jgi:hypothetical protein
MKGAPFRIAPVALLVGAVCTTGATAGPQHTKARQRPVRSVFYQFTARFGLGLDVNWSWDEGSRASGCNWTHREGTWEVDAASMGTLPGSFRSYPRPTSQGWAYLGAVGKAKAEVKRTLVQEGRTSTSTGGCRAQTFQPTDCGRQEYTTRAAALTATWRGNVDTLEGRTTEPARGRAPAIAVSVPPLRQLYRACDLPIFVPQAAGLPGDIGLLADPRSVRALKPGRNYRYDRKTSGQCMKELPDGVTCTYTLDLFVDMHRLTQKEILEQARKGR